LVADASKAYQESEATFLRDWLSCGEGDARLENNNVRCEKTDQHLEPTQTFSLSALFDTSWCHHRRVFHFNCSTFRTGNPSAGPFINENYTLVTDWFPWGCHLRELSLFPMERHLLSYWRIPLAGNVTGSDEVKKKVFIVGVRTDTAEEQFKKQLDGKQGLAAVRQACAAFARKEAEEFFSSTFQVSTSPLALMEATEINNPDRNPDGESPRFNSPIWIENQIEE
jgi:hypothetical protein